MPMTEVSISFSYFGSVQSESFAIRKTLESIRENPTICSESGAQASRQSTACMQRPEPIEMAAFVTTALRRWATSTLLACLFLPLLVRGEVGAIPIATGEVQRQHTRDAYSCTQALVVCLRETGTNAADDPSKTPASCRSTIRATLDDALRRADSRGC